MATKVKPIPDGYHSVTPYLTVRGADKALDWYRQALGAETTTMMRGPDGKVVHAEMRIGNSRIMLGDESPEMGNRSPQSLGGAAGGLLLYVDNADAVFERAVKAGAKVKMPLADQFWGDRYGTLEDPYGQQWSVATHVEDVTEQQMDERFRAMISQNKPNKP